MITIERADGVLILDATTGAGPDLPGEVRLALRELVVSLRGSGRRGWAVLGEMPGLGDLAGEEHDVLGRLAVRLDVPRLISVGDPAGPVGRLHAGAVLEGSWDGEAVHAADAHAALALLDSEIEAGDVVLVAGDSATLGEVVRGLGVGGLGVGGSGA